MATTSLTDLFRPDVSYFATTRVTTLSHALLMVLDLLRKRLEELAYDLVRIGVLG